MYYVYHLDYKIYLVIKGGVIVCFSDRSAIMLWFVATRIIALARIQCPILETYMVTGFSPIKIIGNVYDSQFTTQFY